MAFEAEFVHGSPLMADHTPAAAVAAGEVVVVGDQPLIAHRAIAADELGALAVRGGVYRMPKATGTDTAIANGVKVYWNNSSNVITTTATSNKLIGYTRSVSVNADTHQLVEHAPNS